MIDYVAVKKPKAKDRAAVEAAIRAILGPNAIITSGFRGRLEGRRA